MLAKDAASVNLETVINENNVNLVISRILNADQVPFDLIDTVRQFQKRMLSKGVTQSVTLKDTAVKQFNIQIGNMTLDLKNVKEDELLSTLQLPPSAESDKGGSGKINWSFEGINQFESITIRIKDRRWEVEFSRLQRPYHGTSLPQKEIKTKAHRGIYEKLYETLKPVDKNAPRGVVILQGCSGLGKTHSVQHYFYNLPERRHQIVAWLSGKSQEAFLKDWKALAQQLRDVQTPQSTMRDDEVIKEWCENQLGQWLFIIDEVNVDSDWLNSHLPKQGGYVLITTHQPNYQLQANQATLVLSPLSAEDSKELLQVYLGNYWQATGQPQEQKALDYLIEVLGGYPSVLTQMALLVHKKCISFERLVEQFKQPILRNYLLADTVFDQLKDQTFIAVVKKGWEQLLAYFGKRYPQLKLQQHEQHLKRFVSILQQEMIKKNTQGKKVKEEFEDEENQKANKKENKEIKLEKEGKIKRAVEPETLISQQIDSHIIQDYWQAVETSYGNVNFNIIEIKCWLHCLPIFYDKTNNQWQVSQAGITALSFLSNCNSMPDAQRLQVVPIAEEAVEAKLTEVANTLKFPREIDISVRLEDANLKNAEIDILTNGKSSEFKVWQLPTVNPYFIPRPKLTDELIVKLPKKKSGEESAKLLLTAATGMGGIGKTELARHFVTNKELSDHYQRRFWLTATTASQIRNEFMQLAVYLGLVEAKKYIEDKELIHLIHRLLSINPGWLMVLDNADDYNSIVEWIPKEGGAVLVTTRELTPGTMRPEQIIPVPLLEPEEAVTWLFQLSKRDKDSLSEQERLAAKKLVDDLGYLPLAIAQASAYLREQPNVSIVEYQTRFIILLSDSTLENQDESILENKENDPDMKARKVVASTWMLSLQAIEAYAISHDIPNLAKELLLSCTYYAPKNIPLLLLECLIKEFYQIEPNLIGYLLDEYIGQLVKYSLLERKNTESLVSMHRLLQQVINNFLIKKENNINYLLKAIGSLYSIYPYGKDQMVNCYEKKVLKLHLDQVLIYLDNCIDNLILLNNAKAKQLVAELQKNVLVPILKYLADASDVLGDSKKTKLLLERMLELEKLYYGKEHIEVALTLVNVANAYGVLGDQYKQKEMLEYALKMQEAHYGNEHISVATTLYNLAEAYGEINDFKGKVMLLERALKIQEAYYGKNHVELAITSRNLGNAYLSLGNIQQAKELIENALKIIEVHYGEEHVFVAITLGFLSNVYALLGDLKKRKELLYRNLKIIESYYGKEHLEVAVSLYNLAIVYGDLGEIKNKEMLLGRSLKIKEAHYGKNHIKVARILYALGMCNLEQHNTLLAQNYIQNAYNIYVESPNYGKKHVETQKVKLMLDEMNLQLLIFTNHCQTPLINQFENQIKSNSEDYQLFLRLADQNYVQGNLEQAIQCYAAAIILSPENSHAYHNLACLCNVQKNFVLAVHYFKKALALKGTAATYCDYGLLLLGQKNYEKAVKNLLIATALGDDGSSLFYGKLDRDLLDKYLKQEITDDSHFAISPIFIAHYWLIQCFMFLEENIFTNFYLNKLTQLIQQFPSALHYRILSYIHRVLGKDENAEQSMKIATSIVSGQGNNHEQKIFIMNQAYLNELSELVERSPTSLRYRLLSYVFSAIDNKEKAQDCMALALSLEPTVETPANSQISLSQNNSQYNSTLFGNSRLNASSSENLPQQPLSLLKVLLQKAKISSRMLHDKEVIEIRFIDAKVVQQFTDELHKIGISNLGMKDAPRKPSVILGKEGQEDEYFILLTADEYNNIIKDKSAYANLIKENAAKAGFSL